MAIPAVIVNRYQRFLLMLCIGLWSPVSLAQAWHPYPVELYDTSRHSRAPFLRMDYVPLAGTSQPWELCASLPHLDNAYWQAVSHGLVLEARRLGVGLRLSAAGGYDEVERQIQQIRDCVEAGGQAVIIAAVDNQALNRLVVDLRTLGLPVIDLITRMDTPLITAQVTSPSAQMARWAGMQIAGRHPPGSDVVEVAWFPGPESVGFVAEVQRGLQEALQHSEAQVVATYHGPLELSAQQALVARALAQYPELRYIVGNALAVEAALALLNEANRLGQVTVFAYHFTPGLFSALRQGFLLAVPSDAPVILGRIALDQGVRILEGVAFIEHLGTRMMLIEPNTLDILSGEGQVLAPEDYTPVYRVEAADLEIP